MNRLLFSLVLCVIADMTVAAKFPIGLPKCHYGETACLAKVIDTYVRTYKDGLSDANLFKIDPLFVKEVDIIQGSNSPVNINLNFKNVSVYGLSSLRTTKVVGFEKDPATSKFEISAKIKQLSLIGAYKVSGSVIILPVRGSGPANLTLDNVEFSMKLIPKVEQKRGKQYVSFTGADANFSTTRLWMKFEQLFDGKDRLLSDSTNAFLNENWPDILQELKPVLRKAIGEILTGIVSPVFAKFPYDSLFLD